MITAGECSMGSAPQMILTQETVTLDSKQPLATRNLGLTRARDLPNILLLMVDVALPDNRPSRPFGTSFLQNRGGTK